MKKQTLKQRLRSWYYTNPDCPHCNMYDNVRIVVVLLLMLGGIMMIYYFRHDMESQCCQAVKKLNQQAALAMAGDSKYMIAGEVRNRGLLQNISYVDTGIRLPTE